MRSVERIVAWYRLSSSVGALVALVVANAIPLVGALFLGWNVWNILVVYWLENGIVGIFNVMKMARAELPGRADGLTINGRPVTGSVKGTLIPFFIIHYGIFWFVHGIFVLTMPFFTGMFDGRFGGELLVDDQNVLLPVDPSGSMALLERPAAGIGGFEPGAILFAALALAISHGLSFWWNFLRGGEYRRASAAGQMFAPYGRLVALHLTIILGAMSIIATGAPAAAVAILVAVKTLLDIGFHLAEHRKAAGGSVAVAGNDPPVAR
jgi:hypothetical protein